MDRRVITAAAVFCACLVTWVPASGQATAPEEIRGYEPRPEMREVVNRTLDLDESDVARLDVPRESIGAFRLSIPHRDASLTLDLAKHSVRANDYKLFHQVEGGAIVEMEPGEVRTYRGTVEEIPGSIVAGSLTSGGFEGKVFMPDDRGNVIIEPLRRSLAVAGEDDHVIYRSMDRDVEIGGICGMEHAAPNGDAIHHGARGATARGIDGINVAQLACDADFEYFVDLGSETEARIETLVNTVNAQYERDTDITHEITAIIVRTTSNDPYTSNDSATLVNEVLNEWNDPSAFPSVNRDVVHLFTGKNIAGNVIGRAATIGGICTSLNGCFSQAEYNGVFDCASALVAHELGHLWGAFHCDCVNFTMNPFNTCENQFSQGSIDSILAHRDSRTCLSPLETAFTTLPLDDDFPDSELNPLLWIGTEGTPEVNGDALNEPSGDLSLNLSGTDEVRSARIDSTLQDELVMTYSVQRTGGGDSPEPGEDLIFEYTNPSGDWVEADRFPGDGPDMVDFEERTIMLGDDAEHEDVRVRFRNTSTSDGFDDFFIDDVTLSSTPILPGPFALNNPADGATGVSVSPGFNWQASEFANDYILQIDDDPDFSSPILDFSTGLTAFSNPGFQLPGDGVYFWRVFAENVNGQTIATEPSRSFTVGNPVCVGDCDNNGVVDFNDLVAALFRFGQSEEACDADGNGTVEFNDLTATLFRFGPCE